MLLHTQSSLFTPFRIGRSDLPEPECIWSIPDDAVCKVEPARDENAHGAQLEDDACDHDVCCALRGARGTGAGCCLSAPNGLEDEGDDVGEDEDDEVLLVSRVEGAIAWPRGDISRMEIVGR